MARQFQSFIPGYTGEQARTSVAPNPVNSELAGVGFTTAGRLFAGLAQLAGAAEDRRAFSLGRNAGALAGLNPDGFAERPVGTISGDAYNAAATDTFNKRLEMQANTKIAELSAQHAADPMALDASLSAYRDGVLSEIEDAHPQTAGVFKLAFANMAGDAVLQAQGARQKQIIDENRATTAAVIDQRSAIATQFYRRAGGGDAAALQLGNVQRDAVVAELVANGPAAPFTINGQTYAAGSGAFTAQEIQTKVSKLDQELSSQAILGWWQKGSPTVARAQAWRSNAPANLTQDQIDKTYNSMISDAKDAITVAEHQDHIADQATTAAGKVAAKALQGALADGALTRDMLEKAAPVLSVADYTALLHGLTSPPDVKDDSDTVSLLQGTLGGENWTADASEALASGHLTVSTFLSMSSKNTAITSDDKPQTPYKSGRSLIKDTLDPGQLLSGPAAQIARAGMAQALVEFDNYAEANPDLPRADMVNEAQNTIKRYQVVNYNQLALATGLPVNYGGTASEMSLESLSRAAQLTVQQKDAGQITQAQYDLEARKIETWRYLLSQKPIDQEVK